MATVIRTFDVRSVHVRCTSRDARQRVVRAQADRFVIRGVARGNGTIELRVNDDELRHCPAPGDTPLKTALRLREVLAPCFGVLMTVPSEAGGEVCVTVLSR